MEDTMGTTELREMALRLAIHGVEATRILRDCKEYEIGSQLLRSSTSVGANISESEYAQSRSDFVSKLRIALKECNETLWWLRLLKSADIFENDEMVACAKSVKYMLIASVNTALKGKGGEK